MPRTQRTYDHRLRDLVRRTGDVGVAIGLGVPRSTAAGWLRSGSSAVVTTEQLGVNELDPRIEVHLLRRRLDKLRIVVRLLAAVHRALDIDLERRRIDDAATKRVLLCAIDRAQSELSLRSTLRILGLSRSRYHVWKREDPCHGPMDSSPPE